MHRWRSGRCNVRGKDLKMAKVALVTGGTRGIGEAISEKLHNDGFIVISNYSSNDEAAENFSKRTGIKSLKWDVSDFESCKKAINQILEKNQKIDVLVNNAGITRDAPLHKMSLENWRKVIDVNLNSIFNVLT